MISTIGRENFDEAHTRRNCSLACSFSAADTLGPSLSGCVARAFFLYAFLTIKEVNRVRTQISQRRTYCLLERQSCLHRAIHRDYLPSSKGYSVGEVKVYDVDTRVFERVRMLCWWKLRSNIIETAERSPWPRHSRAPCPCEAVTSEWFTIRLDGRAEIRLDQLQFTRKLLNRMLTLHGAQYVRAPDTLFVVDMLLQELVLCSTTPTAQNTGPGTVTLHDIQTGTTLASFKQTSAAPHCTAVMPSRDGQGGFMLTAQTDKSIMNVYNFQKVRVLAVFIQ